MGRAGSKNAVSGPSSRLLQGVESIVTLRALRLSRGDRWERYWNNQPNHPVAKPAKQSFNLRQLKPLRISPVRKPMHSSNHSSQNPNKSIQETVKKQSNSYSIEFFQKKP